MGLFSSVCEPFTFLTEVNSDIQELVCILALIPLVKVRSFMYAFVETNTVINRHSNTYSYTIFRPVNLP
jgi:hypothetical protein